VVQIALDGEVAVEAIRHALPVLEAAPEFELQALLREIGDMRHHASDRETPIWHRAMGQVIAIPEIRVGHDGLSADRVEGDILCG